MSEEAKDKDAKAGKDQKPASVGISFVSMLIQTVLTFMACFGASYFAFQMTPKSINIENIIHQASKPATGTNLPVYPLGDFVVNLADPGGSRFLKTSITAKLYSTEPEGEGHKEEGGGGGHGGGDVDPETAAIEHDLHHSMPAVKDLVISTLSRKTADELQNYDVKLSLKEELVDELNHILHGDFRVYDLYFTDFIVQ